MKIKVYETKICEQCENEFQVNIKNKDDSKKRFCSGFCAKKHNGLNNKGKKRTEEFKKILSEESKGIRNSFFGKTHTEESLNKMRESSKWKEDKFKYCNMNNLEKEIFDGIMLSDGCLDSSRISSRLSLGFKYKETIERIISDLKSLNFCPITEYESRPHIKTGKRYIGYFTNSHSYHDLLSEYNRWYPNKKKIIPSDLKLTPTLCYWWYVCDGYIENDNVYLCTDSFLESDLDVLKLKLNDLNFDVSIRSDKRVFFKKTSSKEFLKWISTNLEIQKEYLYKWKIKNVHF